MGKGTSKKGENHHKATAQDPSPQQRPVTSMPISTVPMAVMTRIWRPRNMTSRVVTGDQDRAISSVVRKIGGKDNLLEESVDITRSAAGDLTPVIGPATPVDSDVLGRTAGNPDHDAMPVLAAEDPECPFGPRLLGLGWAWSWWGKDPCMGANLFHPSRIGNHSDTSRVSPQPAQSVGNEHDPSMPVIATTIAVVQSQVHQEKMEMTRGPPAPNRGEAEADAVSARVRAQTLDMKDIGAGRVDQMTQKPPREPLEAYCSAGLPLNGT
ncbi:hypothetical protein QJS10_CPA08g01097 [Acorus calamus]|uniref:Uncharacterized protein n=1 Tax=Acorus calamus TaxID=4465 RepID=A0AAV9EEB9_ACOCL|nr:hypothetical protein QJS10_CPA08g01097 [Acorus calamus]